MTRHDAAATLMHTVGGLFTFDDLIPFEFLFGFDILGSRHRCGDLLWFMYMLVYYLHCCSMSFTKVEMVFITSLTRSIVTFPRFLNGVCLSMLVFHV